MLDGYYDPYRDFFALAELSGYPTIWLDEIKPQSDNTYILSPLNGSWANGWQEPKARMILWDLEWRLSEGGYQWDKSELVIPPGVSEVWTSDVWYAGITGAKYVPLGSHPGLVQNAAPAPESYDVTFQAYIWGRRNALADRFMEHGLRIAPSRWNPERDALLKSTTAVIHAHQWENITTIAPLRFAIAAAYALPVISEQVHDRGIYDGAALFCQYDAMPEYVSTLTRRYAADLRERGQALYELLCVDHSFRKSVEAAL